MGATAAGNRPNPRRCSGKAYETLRDLMEYKLMEQHGQQQAESVDHDVPLTDLDQLAAIEATAVSPDDGLPLWNPVRPAPLKSERQQILSSEVGCAPGPAGPPG